MPEGRPLPLTRAEIRADLRLDWARIEAYRRAGGNAVLRARWTEVAWLAVWAYRWGRFHHLRGHGLRARLWGLLGQFLTGADLPAGVDLGPGLLIPSPAAVSLCGRAGRNLTVHPLSGLGGELSQDDVGAGPGMPWLGDDVTLEPHSGVLGAVRIGDRVRICAGCIVTEDVPAEARVEPSAPRVLSGGRGAS
jgi:serine O-acetyltransferase